MLATELVIKCVTKEMNWEICLRWGLRIFFYWLPFLATNVINKKNLILVTITISQEIWGWNKTNKDVWKQEWLHQIPIANTACPHSVYCALSQSPDIWRKSDCTVAHDMACCMGHSQLHFVPYTGRGFWRHAPYCLCGGSLRVEVCSKTALTVFTNIPTLA